MDTEGPIVSADTYSEWIHSTWKAYTQTKGICTEKTLFFFSPTSQFNSLINSYLALKSYLIFQCSLLFCWNYSHQNHYFPCKIFNENEFLLIKFLFISKMIASTIGNFVIYIDIISTQTIYSKSNSAEKFFLKKLAFVDNQYDHMPYLYHTIKLLYAYLYHWYSL